MTYNVYHIIYSIYYILYNIQPSVSEKCPSFFRVSGINLQPMEKKISEAYDGLEVLYIRLFYVYPL